MPLFAGLQQPVPHDSLLKTHRDGPSPGAWDHYSDCFAITVDRPVTLAEFVYAFYTSPVFRLERLILGIARLPSTDRDARQLADGTGRSFAAWRVGERTDTQLLMCDVLGRTRSWFSVTPVADGGQARTVLRFGSGIAATVDAATGRPLRRPGSRLLGGLHVLYSRVLLQAARARL